jgi:putative ABC transport system permease protein
VRQHLRSLVEPKRELALRTALGAGRKRIVWQVLTENLLLAFTGGLMGLLLAQWGVDLILALKPPHLPQLENVEMDFTVLGVALATIIACGTLFTLAPGVQALRFDINRTLKQGGPATRGSMGKRLRGFLVVSEVALCLALLIGAGLMVRTFAGVLEIDLGFNPSRVLTFDVATANEAYRDTEIRWTFYRELTNRLESLPGVERAGGAFNLPLGGGLLAAPYAADN